MSDITLTMVTPSLLNWHIVEMKAKEEYNGLSEATLLCYTDDIDPPKNLVDHEAFWFVMGSYDDRRLMGGVIQSITKHEDRDTVYCRHYYTLHIVNALAPLKVNKKSRSWANKTVLEVMGDLIDSPYYITDYTKCLKKYKKLDYVVQYEQSDYSFLQVLCAEHGIFYYQSIDVVGSLQVLKINVADHFASYEEKAGFFHRFFVGQESIDYTQEDQPIFDVRCSTQAVPNVFCGDDYNPMHAGANFLQSYSNDNGVAVSTAPVDVFPLGQLEPDSTYKKIKLIANQQAHQQMQWHFKTEDKHFCIGEVVNIKQVAMMGDLPDMPKSILPICVEHIAKDYSCLQNAEKEVPYSILGGLYQNSTQYYANKVTAIEWKLEPYIPLLDPKHKAKMPGLLTGVVQGYIHQATSVYSSLLNEGPDIPVQTDIKPDKEGRVPVSMHWDAHSSSDYYDLFSYMRVATRQNGITYVPHVGDEVLVAPVNGRPDRFIILGSAYNSETTLPFDIQKNKALAGIKTSGKTGNNPHYFYGDQTKDKERIVMQSYADYNEHVGNRLDTNEQCRYIKDIAENFYQFVQGDMTIEVEDQSLTITAEEAMVFNVGNSQLELLPDCINVYGDVIEIEASLGKSGSLVTLTDQHTCPKRKKDGTKHVGGPVISGSCNVLLAGKAAARMGDQVKCHDNSTNPICQGHSGITINGQPAVIVGHQTKHGGHITSGVANILAVPDLNLGLDFEKKDKNHDVQVKFKLVASSDFDPVITHAMLNLDARDDGSAASHPDKPTDQLRGETVIPDVKGGNYDIRLSPENRELAIYNVNGQPCFPYYRATVKVPDSANPDDKTITSDRQFECKVLWPIMVLNCRAKGEGYDKASAAGASDELDPLDIQYFKNNGNNVTVFIHGYNVPFGKLGDEIRDVYNEPVTQMGSELPNNNPLYQMKLDPAPYKSSIYRDRNILKGQINKTIDPGIFSDASDQDYRLNGSGAMNWFVHMEKNMNTAAGFKCDVESSYEKYTRMLHVTWSGNWGDQNYGEAVDQALSLYQARRLAKDLVKLKKAGLEVNIIAHSLGNGFLLETMNVLAKDHAGIVMDHVFMWEAAVPNNVFNRPKPKNNVIDRWDFKQVLEATQKVTVLHSYNDNVLGPFPTDKQQKADWHKVLKAKPMVEWAPAYFCRLFKLESLYNTAMALNIETHLVLRPDVQEIMYQYLLEQRPDLVAEMGDQETNMQNFKAGKYLPTFEVQIACVENSSHYSHMKQQIQDGVNVFKQDWENKKSHLHIYLANHPYYKDIFATVYYSIEAIKTDAGEYLIGEVEGVGEAAIIGLKVWKLLKWFFRIVAVVAEIASAPEDEGTSLALLPKTLKSLKALVKKTEFEKASGSLVTRSAGLSTFIEKSKEVYTYSEMEITVKHAYHAAYLVHMLTDERLKDWHAPAMGYVPPSLATQKKTKSQVNYVDQTKWLYQHSDMKIPSKDLMTYIYEGQIMSKNKGIKRFGKW